MRLRWRVAGLAVAVAASSAVVPLLIGPAAPSAPVAAPGPTPAATPVPTTTVPTTPPATPTATPKPSLTPKASKKPSPSPSPKVFRRITINATAKGNRRSGVEVIECLTCLSGSRVQYLGQGHTLLVPVRDVPVAGRRTLTIVYTCACSDLPRTLDVRVNDDDPHALQLRGADSWDVPARTKVRVTLRKGDNQIIFYNANEPAPDLDRIEIT